jgi:low temperature requirement protein LtrA
MTTRQRTAELRLTQEEFIMDAKTLLDFGRRRTALRVPAWVAFGLFLAIAAFFLPEGHRVQILGALPFLLLLLCPVIHIFMHHDHGGHGRLEDECRDKQGPRGTKRMEAQR